MFSPANKEREVHICRPTKRRIQQKKRDFSFNSSQRSQHHFFFVFCVCCPIFSHTHTARAFMLRYCKKKFSLHHIVPPSSLPISPPPPRRRRPIWTMLRCELKNIVWKCETIEYCVRSTDHKVPSLPGRVESYVSHIFCSFFISASRLPHSTHSKKCRSNLPGNRQFFFLLLQRCC